MTRISELPVFPPVGTRCLYQNEALKLEGWGVLAATHDALDASELPHLTPWIGTLTGPVSEGQIGLDILAPGCGALPGENRYLIVPAFLLFIEDKEKTP